MRRAIKRVFWGVALLGVLAAGPAGAQDESACVEPALPELPEAAALDEGALKDAKDLTLAYIEEATRYRGCMARASARIEEMIAKTEAGAYRDGLLRRQAAVQEAHDANAARQAALREAFSALVQAYKEAHPQ